MVDKTDNMPIWVWLAFSSIETRKVALSLILAFVIFLYIAYLGPSSSQTKTESRKYF
jgi:hypothetical protein